MPTVFPFNLHWANYLPASPDPVQGQLTRVNKLDRRAAPAPAVILYPALCTPGILTQGPQSVDPALLSGDLSTLPAGTLNGILAASDRVEVLLVAPSSATLTPEVVNRRLKLTATKDGFAAGKRVNLAPLFPEFILAGVPDLIRVVSLGAFRLNTVYRTEARFKGVVDERVVFEYLRRGFDTVYAVSVNAMMLAPAAATGVDAQNHSAAGVTRPFSDRPLDQDKIVHDFCRVNLPADPLARRMQFGFKLFADDVAVGDADPTNPVIAYHPLFFYLNLTSANLAHISDVHCSARQRTMRMSQARVVETQDPVNVPNARPVGDMVNICSQNARQLFTRLSGDPGVDLIVIGGDLVDYIHSNLPDVPPGPLSVTEVWGQLDAKAQGRYFDNTDLVSIYSVLMATARTLPCKPMFAVTGNHDCYLEPYGISPRVLGQRANEGIPADHNLTIYEAILAFGPTFGQVNTVPRSSFHAERLKWFYMVLTPFSDYTVELPKQRMICLGWGDSERLLSPFSSGEQGLTHLPRADHMLTAAAGQLLREGTADAPSPDRKLILTTHFTVVSYDNSISFAAAGPRGGDDGRVLFNNFTRHDMGTFESQADRRLLYGELLVDRRAIQLVLTGHSHRRALYTVPGRLADGTGVATHMFDFPDLAAGTATPGPGGGGPWVVLSDSAGPLPRRIETGEFGGWGSSPPAATRVTVDPSTGDLAAIDRLPVTGPRVTPRFAVAVDYLELLAGVTVFARFDTDPMSLSDEQQDAADYRLNVTLTAALNMLGGVRLTSLMLLHCQRDPDTLKRVRWRACSCFQTPAGQWLVPGDIPTRRFFRQRFAPERNRESFVAVTFEPIDPNRMAGYSFDTPWTFEIRVDKRTSGGFLGIGDNAVQYTLVRDKDSREIPDLTRRGKYPEYNAVTLDG